MRPLILFSFVALAACKNAGQSEEEVKARQAQELQAKAAAELNKNPERAVALLKQAVALDPGDVQGYVALADAYRQVGNDTGAMLTLKQAEQVKGAADPSLKRARADVYLRMHQNAQAIVELSALRDAELLTDDELLELASLQAHAGKIDDAFKTVEQIQKREPDNARAKTVEAEILLARGDEIAGAKLMDKLLTDHPELTDARLLRARYLLANGHPELAQNDLVMISAADAKRADVVTLRARVLNTLQRYDEAEGILTPLVEEQPKDAELLGLLAEIKLLQGHAPEAQALIDRALAREPKWARALYVRGRAHELQNELEPALNDYQAALKSDETFAPALSRVWGLYAKKGSKIDAMTALERLVLIHEATWDEKVALAQLNAETQANLTQGKKLIDEAIAHDPDNAEYKKIRAKLLKAMAPESSGIIIMKHR